MARPFLAGVALTPDEAREFSRADKLNMRAGKCIIHEEFLQAALFKIAAALHAVTTEGRSELIAQAKYWSDYAVRER
jgi:hypothetical protein